MNFKFVIALVSATTLAACSGGAGLLDGKSSVPQGAVAVGNPLALPPDLQLPAPGTASPASYAAAPTITAQPIVKNTGLYGTAAAAPVPAGDVFDRAGINKLRPDGTKKTPAELNQELSIFYMKKKKLQNPSYGTAANIGAIFSDN